MTKKKTTNSNKKSVQPKAEKAGSKRPSAAKTATTNKTVSNKLKPVAKLKPTSKSKPTPNTKSKFKKDSVSKNTVVKKIVPKSKSPKRSPQKTEPKNNTRISNIKEGESKVREIASKNNFGKVEEKKVSKGFSLDDVRSVLKNKSEGILKKVKSRKKSEPVEEKILVKPVKISNKSTKVRKLQTASIDDILGFGTTLGPSRPIRDEKKVPKVWFSYYKDLMGLRASLKGALGERSHDTLGASARESSGELSLNSSDAGSETFNRDVALSMVASEQEALEEIEDAIDRIFDGTFGVCQETKKPIKKSRLKVVPFTRFSLEGQTLYEQRKHKEKDSGGGTFATISDSTMGVEE